MTQKEKLANEYVELKKQYDGENFLETARENQIWWLTKEFKVIDLQDKIEAVRNAIEQKAKRLAKEAWYETEEGKAFKEQNEAARKELYEQIIELRHSGFEHTRKVVKALLSEEFDVISFCGGSMEIGIVEEYREDGTAKGLFGHDFDVYFGEEIFNDGFQWEMNYGSMGSFNIGQDKKRIEFLVGMAKFASDTVVIPALKEYLHGMVRSIKVLQRAGYKLEREYDNPPMLAA